MLPTLLPFQLYGLGCGIFPFPNHWITICMIEGDAILLLFSIIIEVMNTKAYNGVRYLSKNGHYYTENCIAVVIQWL